MGWDGWFTNPIFNLDGNGKEAFWDIAKRGGFQKGDIEKRNYLHNQTVMYARRAFETLGIDNLCDENLTRASDWEFGKKMEIYGVQFGFVDEYVAVARWHDNGITGKNRTKNGSTDIVKEAEAAVDPLEKSKLYVAALRQGVEITSSDYTEFINNLPGLINESIDNKEREKAVSLAHRNLELNPSETNKRLYNKARSSMAFFFNYKRNFAHSKGFEDAKLRAVRAYAFDPWKETGDFLKKNF